MGGCDSGQELVAQQLHDRRITMKSCAIGCIGLFLSMLSGKDDWAQQDGGLTNMLLACHRRTMTLWVMGFGLDTGA
jgi:hypothetical protein